MDRTDVERLLAAGEPTSTVDVTVIIKYRTALVLDPDQLRLVLDDTVALDDLAAELLSLEQHDDWEIGVGPLVVNGAEVDLRQPEAKRL